MATTKRHKPEEQIVIELPIHCYKASMGLEAQEMLRVH